MTILSPGWNPPWRPAISGTTLLDEGRHDAHAVGSVQAGVKHDRQQEIGDWAGRHHGCALRYWLGVERPFALLRRHARERFRRRLGGGVFVVDEFDVAAKRDPRKPPARAVLIVKPKISGPKPIENALTVTPHQRATRKWPSSWMKTTSVSTSTNTMP